MLARIGAAFEAAEPVVVTQAAGVRELFANARLVVIIPSQVFATTGTRLHWLDAHT